MICEYTDISEKDSPKCQLQGGCCLIFASQDLCPFNPNNKLSEYKRGSAESRGKEVPNDTRKRSRSAV